jgi:hypothetical protein
LKNDKPIKSAKKGKASSISRNREGKMTTQRRLVVTRESWETMENLASGLDKKLRHETNSRGWPHNHSQWSRTTCEHGWWQQNLRDSLSKMLFLIEKISRDLGRAVLPCSPGISDKLWDMCHMPWMIWI